MIYEAGDNLLQECMIYVATRQCSCIVSNSAVTKDSLILISFGLTAYIDDVLLIRDHCLLEKTHILSRRYPDLVSWSRHL